MIDIKFTANTVTELKELIRTFLGDGLTTHQNEIHITAQKAEEPKKAEEQVLPTSGDATYKKEDLQRAAVALMDKDKSFNPAEFLSRFGASAFSDIPDSRYNDFANELRKLGGEI